jgi:hypothetical protein
MANTKIEMIEKPYKEIISFLVIEAMPNKTIPNIIQAPVRLEQYKYFWFLYALFQFFF